MAVDSPGVTEAADHARVDLYAPAPMAPLPSPPPAAVAPRRRRSLFWYAAMLVAVVVTLGGFGMLYVDDQSWQRDAAQLREDNGSLHEQLLTSQAAASDAQQQVKDLQAELKHPNLGLWNVPEKINGPDWYLAGGVPDTFTYHLNATATGPMNVSIVTFEQFAAGLKCVDDGQSDANYCLHHPQVADQKVGPPVKSFLGVRSVSYDFHLAEGCAGYMVVFTAPSAVTVNPDVSVTYNPAPTFTGECG